MMAKWIKNLNDFVVEFRLMRRVLVCVLTYFFVRVSIDFFSDLSAITVQAGVAYGLLVGLEREILRFYWKGTKEEADSD